MKSVACLLIILSAVFAAPFLHEFSLNMSDSSVFPNGIGIKLVDMQPSAGPGKSPNATFEFTDLASTKSNTTIVFPASTTIAFPSVTFSVRVASGTLSGQPGTPSHVELSVINQLRPTIGTKTSFELNTTGYQRAFFSDAAFFIELVRTASSSQPGVGGNVTFILSDTEYTKKVGEYIITNYGGTGWYNITVTSIALGPTGDYPFYKAEFTVEPYVEPTPTPSPTPGPKLNFPGCGYFVLNDSYPVGVIGTGSSATNVRVDSVYRSTTPGVGGKVLFFLDPTMYNETVGFETEYDGRFFELKEAGSSGSSFQAAFMAKQKVVENVTFTLNNTCYAAAGLADIELYAIYTSNQPGVGGLVSYHLDGVLGNSSVGVPRAYGDYQVTVKETMVDGTTTAISAAFVIEKKPAATAAATVPPTPSPTATAAPQSTNMSAPVSVAGEAPASEEAQDTRIAETTSTVTEHTASGNTVTYKVEGDSSVQGFLEVSNAPWKPKAVTFDGTELPECSVSLLQTCIANLLGGSSVNMSGCLCWSFNDDAKQLEIFYPHSEHTIVVDYGAEATATPAPAPTSTPEPSPPSSEGQGFPVVYALAGLAVLAFIAAAAFFMTRKPPEQPKAAATEPVDTMPGLSGEKPAA